MSGIYSLFTAIAGRESRVVQARIADTTHAELLAATVDGVTIGDIVRQAVEAYRTLRPRLHRIARISLVSGQRPEVVLGSMLDSALSAEDAMLGLPPLVVQEAPAVVVADDTAAV